MSLMPIFLFLVSGFYWQKSRLFLSFYSLPLLHCHQFKRSDLFAWHTAVRACSICASRLIEQKQAANVLTGFFSWFVDFTFVFVRALKTNGSKLYRLIIKQKPQEVCANGFSILPIRRGLKTPRIRLRFKSQPLFHAIRHKPLFGAKMVRFWLTMGMKKRAQFPHAQPLQIIFEFGYLGTLLFLFGLWR